MVYFLYTSTWKVEGGGMDILLSMCEVRASRKYWTLQTIFHLCILKKGFCQASRLYLLNISKKELIPTRQMNFQYILCRLWKAKIFFGNIFSLYKFFLSRNSYVCPIWIFVVDIDQAQINKWTAKIFPVSSIGDLWTYRSSALEELDSASVLTVAKLPTKELIFWNGAEISRKFKSLLLCCFIHRYYS